MKKKRSILFVSGTRADFGKLRPLMDVVDKSPDFECNIFVTGMHELSLYGRTVKEIKDHGYKNIYRYVNQFVGEPMEVILANTILGMSRYVHENTPDMIVVHGDRVEALAGAIVGSMKNIRVAHVEGGERSGTIDEMIRHSVTKLSHIHFVANNEAATRLRQMGETPDSIFIIGSPDIDVMVSKNLPDLKSVMSYYEIPFKDYAVLMFHPVTTEKDVMRKHSEYLVSALLEDTSNYVVIYPNNDEGTNDILQEYERLKGNKRFRVFPSINFEKFLVMLKNAEFCIGNSSAGIREAPFYGIPTLNIGTRQNNRYFCSSITNVGYEKDDILAGIKKVKKIGRTEPSQFFGTGDSSKLFFEALSQESMWDISIQKSFQDLDDDFPALLKNMQVVNG